MILPKCISSNSDLRGGEKLRIKEKGDVDISSFKEENLFFPCIKYVTSLFSCSNFSTNLTTKLATFSGKEWQENTTWKNFENI